MKLMNWLFGRPVDVSETKPMLDVPKLSECARDKYDGNPLVCSGCAHSAGSAPFPGRPSGERPCFFCVRNTDRDEWKRAAERHFGGQLPDNHPANGRWYDGSKAMALQMDCYRSVDMLRQAVIWDGGSADDHIIT